MSVSAETFDRIKTQLRQARDLGQPIKQDLYSHLIEVFNRIMLHHPDDGYDKFEEISALVKQTNFKIRDPKSDFDVNGNASQAPAKVAEMNKVLNKIRALMAEEPDLVSAEDRHLISNKKPCKIENFVESAQMLEWAGIGFGEERSFLIQKSLQRLAVVSGASSIKLFGKILCTKSDYWVAQGVLPGEEEAPTNKNQEKRGQGVNATVFWVTNNFVNDWIQLPDAQPEHIAASRLIKKQLTGELSAEIDSCPPFPGREKHLLRAQLARIQHATEIIPKGLYEIDEETQELKMAEADAMPDLSTEPLKSLEAWVHLPRHILNVGRCTHTVPDDIAEDEREGYIEKLNETDKAADPLFHIAEDKGIEGRETCWSSTVCGDTTQYKQGEGSVSYGVNVLRSLRWPGSVTVAKGGQYCTIYVGDCVKKGDTCFSPTDPPAVQSDPAQQPDHEEPFGEEPKPEPAEGAEGEGEGEAE